MDKVEELLTRGVANIVPSKEKLKKLLLSGKKFNIYVGIDPTATRIHLGHAVVLRKLKAFAKLEHKVTFLIGDFTAQIGDTSDKENERPVLTPIEIHENFKTYKKQAEKILDFSKIKIVYNSEWLSKLNFSQVIELSRYFSINDFISRELIKKRLGEGKRVRLDEIFYPLMQGYDSLKLETDIQIGGTDQTFNMQAGRTLIKNIKDRESSFIATKFLTGSDGRKMSKTYGNAIWLDNDPIDMYAKVMAIQDDLIIEYYTLGTDASLSEIDEVDGMLKTSENPMKIKKQLAHRITSEFNNKDGAEKAANYFESVIQKQENPFELPLYMMPQTRTSGASISDVVFESGLAVSKSQAKRVIQQAGTVVNNEIVRDPNTPFTDYLKNNEAIIKVGKKNFVKIKITG